MPKRISDVFHVDASALRAHNVFNGFIEIDSKFYVDPRLLVKTSACELENSYEKFTNYFNDVLNDVLQVLESHEDIQTVIDKLRFSEIPLTGLGYSVNHTVSRQK